VAIGVRFDEVPERTHVVVGPVIELVEVLGLEERAVVAEVGAGVTVRGDDGVSVARHWVTVLSVQELGGKVAVVTGGGGGIGRALGERFLAERMKVVLADIDEPLLKSTIDELQRRWGDAVIGVVTDVSSLESVESLRDTTLSAFGAVHLVCNNAAIPSGSDGALWEHHVNDWRWAVDVNVYGVIHGI